jgi:hypothetical protein
MVTKMLPSAINTPSASGAAPITEPMSMCALGSAKATANACQLVRSEQTCGRDYNPRDEKARQENSSTFATLMVIGAPRSLRLLFAVRAARLKHFCR